MNKKGFTLVELLAVLAIIGVIVLIAVPVVINTLNNSKEKALKDSAYGLMEAGKIYYGNSLSNPKDFSLPKIAVGPDYDGIEFEGKEYQYGKLIVENDKKIAVALYDEGQCAYKKMSDSKVTVVDNLTEEECTNQTVTKYSIGDAILFNPETGTMCHDYTESQSSGTSNTGCLKWYVIKNRNNEIDLLADHNMEYSVPWITDSSGNQDGPDMAKGYVLDILKTTTANWAGVLTRTDSYTDPAFGYTIDYTGYKARLIEANEVWEISKSTNGKPNWDSGKEESVWFYLDGIQMFHGKSNYAWLYDYTYNCMENGCNVEISDYSHGYWTSSASIGSVDYVWVVEDGALQPVYGYYRYKDYRFGLRPVITISKSQIY